MKKLLTFSICIFIIVGGQSQTLDSITSNELIYSHDKSKFWKADFLQVHGYYGISGEMFNINDHFYNALFQENNLTKIEPNNIGYLGWIGIMRNKFFYNISFSWSPTASSINDSLSVETKLRQNSIAIRIGYNLLAKKWVVLSPNIGFRLSRFRLFTKDSNKTVPIYNYFKNPNIDLNIGQYSATGGLNVTFSDKRSWSFGFYTDYLLDLHKNPIIKSNGNRITNNYSNPLDKLVIGIGMGFMPQ